MSTTEKHHCMAVFKSDHFGAADLEEHLEQGGSAIFRIIKVEQKYGVKVAGKKGDHNIATFEGNHKPWVLNSTNTKQLRKFQGGLPMVEDWKPMVIELYVDEAVKAVTGGITQGVRIRPIQPDLGKKVRPMFSEVNFEPAAKVKATIETIKKAYDISPETETAYLKYLSEYVTAKSRMV